ncbi:MAG: inositol monophosphatase [Haloarculaceae archaeon]
MTDAMRRAVVAERAARAGGVVAQDRFRTEIPAETKANRNDLVTEADREAQEQVITTIREEFPSDALVCEEDAAPPGPDEIELHKSIPESGDVWIVDPIDGTGNYVRDIRFWTTSVAAVVNGSPVGVATYLPAEGDIYTAGPESVTRNGSQMAVSDRSDPETFAVALIGGWPARHGARYASLFRATASEFGDLRRLGSIQGVLALVAAGSLDAAFMPAQPHPWDAIAGVHLIRRAGGTATDIDGDRWQHDSEGLVVSNGETHDTVLATIHAGLNETPAG